MSSEEEKPLFLIGIDQSESILANKDSSQIKELINSLKENVKTIDNVELKRDWVWK